MRDAAMTLGSTGNARLEACRQRGQGAKAPFYVVARRARAKRVRVSTKG